MSYSISGNVQIGGATIFYSGSAEGSVLSDVAGNYLISNLNNGTYTLTPSLENHDFSPSSQTVTILGASLIVNFKDPANTSGSWLTVNNDNYLRGVRH